uniref:Cadherin domain-containing protein n=2 Tax=Myripristis murdjan TaxID=586833 RepID=A0A667ZAX5_9TELE
MICQGAGYSGSVVLTEQEVGVLPLTPGPLYAIDGDFGINEEITYRFLSGNDAGLFQIGAESGNITMVRAADVPGPINLTVLAAQKLNSFQYATTKVTIRVLLRSRNPPRFERTSYGAVVTGVGTMALDSDNTTQPLRIQATDADFAGGVNPDVTYNIKGSSGFSLIGGYLFMTEDRPLGSVTFQVAAVDTVSGEMATAELSVEVTSGLTTTQATPTTQTTPTEETTGVPTSNSSMTTEDSHSTASTAPPPTGGVPGVMGGYGPEAMAALGASLAVLLAVCLLVIGLLLCRMKKSKADWRKMTEANVFRSSLAQGPGGQFTNEAFQSDEDAVSSHSAASQEVDLKPGGGQQGIEAVSVLGKEAGIKSTAAPYIVPHAVLPGDSSSRGSNNDEDEVEVKPILTKERRAEDGYKSVWFKEDIDPNAKQEVVIIPDNREGEGEGEEGSS